MPKRGERLPWKVQYTYRTDPHGAPHPTPLTGRISCYTQEDAEREAAKVRALGGEARVYNADERKRRP